MKVKSLICILMILAMLFSFAACGDVAPQPAASETPVIPEATPDTAAPSPAPVPDAAPT